MSSGPTWSESGHSDSGGGARTEAAACPGTFHVRAREDTSGPRLTFAAEAWALFAGHAAGR